MADSNNPPGESEKTKGGKKEGKKPTAFQTEILINSKRFSQYHPDFLRALLPDERYTMSDAESIVKGYFGKGGT